MKLGELKALIRNTKGNPIINISLGDSAGPMRVAVQKASLLSELDRIYPGGKSVETGHVFDEATGVLTVPDVASTDHEDLVAEGFTEIEPEPFDDDGLLV